MTQKDLKGLKSSWKDQQRFGSVENKEGYGQTDRQTNRQRT